MNLKNMNSTPSINSGQVDSSQVKKIYFIGIKGVAMSGLAIICKQKRFTVAGSDLAEKFITDPVLRKNKIKTYTGFAKNHIKEFKPDLVVVGASWGEDNPEVQAAKTGRIKIITESDLRGILSQEKFTIAVTGAHGKTTTTAWLAYIFSQAGLKPSYLYGSSQAFGLKTNGNWSKGKHFIVEGDEYVKSPESKRPKFLDLSAKITLITSLEWEHVDVYKDLASIERAFTKLITKTLKNKGKVVACYNWPSIREIIKDKKNIITYGFDRHANWLAYDISYRSNLTIFKVKKNKKFFGQFKIKLPGEHNVLNALACIIIADSQDIKKSQISKALYKFTGCERRFNVKKSEGVIFIDDYAHHPTEIKATLQAVRQKYPDKFARCVFQPHTFSRTKALLDEFGKSFFACDQVLFTDIFASAREKKKAISSKDLLAKTKYYHKNAKYTGTFKKTSNYLKKNIKKGEVVVIMGAGDVYKLMTSNE